jgi:sporulation protein YlmC with PRC-barrel domain
MIVENRDGQRLGKVEDFIVDTRSGNVDYALVSSSHGLGLRRRFHILPPQLLSAATAKKGVLELDIGYTRWQHAPRFKMTDLAAVSSSQQKEQIYSYFSQSVTNQPVHTPERHTTTGHLEFATLIIGMKVANRQHQPLGHFSDLLVDLSGQRTVLAVVIPDRAIVESGSFAVPLSLLRPSGATRLLILDASRKRFADAPILDEQSWTKDSAGGAGTIYRFPDGAIGAEHRSASEVSEQNSFALIRLR